MNTLILLWGCASPSPSAPPAVIAPVKRSMAVASSASQVGPSTVFGAPEWRIKQASDQGLLFVHPRLGVQLSEGPQPDPSAWVEVDHPEYCGPTAEPTVLRCRAPNPSVTRSYVDVASGETLAQFTPTTRGGNEQSVVMEGGWLIQQQGAQLLADNLFSGAHAEHTLQEVPTKLTPLSATHLSADLRGFSQVLYIGGGQFGAQFRARFPIAGPTGVVWFEPGKLILQRSDGRSSAEIPHAIHRRSMAISGDGSELGIAVQQQLPDQSFQDRLYWFRLGPQGPELFHEAPANGGEQMLATANSVVAIHQDEERIQLQGPSGSLGQIDTGAYQGLTVSSSGAQWVWGHHGPVIDTANWTLSGPREPHPGFRLKSAISADGQWILSCTLDRDRVAIWHKGALLRELNGGGQGCVDLAFSESGERALASSKVLSLPQGEVLLDLNSLALRGRIAAAALSPDGEQLTVVSTQSSPERHTWVQSFRVQDGAELWQKELKGKGLTVMASLAYTDGGSGLAVGRVPRELSLMRSETGQIQKTRQVGNGVGYVRSDGQERLAVVTGIHGGPQMLYVFEQGKEVYRQKDVADVQFDPQGRLVLLLSGLDTVYERRDLDSGLVEHLSLPMRPWTHSASSELLLVGADGEQLWLQGWGEE